MKIVKTVTAGICVTSSLVAAEITTPNGQGATDSVSMEQKVEQSLQIQKITSLKDVPWNLLKEGDVVIFDIHNVTIYPESHLIMNNEHAKDRIEFTNAIKNTIGGMAGEERVAFAYKQVQYAPVEPEMIEIIKRLHDNGVRTCGVSVARNGVPEGDTVPAEITLRNNMTHAGITFRAPFDDGDYSFLTGNNAMNTMAIVDKVDFRSSQENLVIGGMLLTNKRFKSDPLSKIMKLSLIPLPETIFMIDKTEGPLKDISKDFPGVIKGFQYERSFGPLDQEVVGEQLKCLLQDNPEFPTDKEVRQRIEAQKKLEQ